METKGFVGGYDEVGKGNGNEAIAVEEKRCAERIWNAITKYVVYDKDAIFKDPNWPHLWLKK